MDKCAAIVVCVAMLGLPWPAAAADPPGVVYHSQNQAPTGTADAVERKISNKVAFGSRDAFRVRRGANSAAEMHTTHSHSLMVQGGEATIVLDGEVVDARGKPAAPNVAGTSIRRGTEYTLSTGDVMYIPAFVNHQWLVPPGKEFTYLVVNIDEPGTNANRPHASYYASTTEPSGKLDPVELKVSQPVAFGERTGIIVRRGAAGAAENHDDHSHAIVVQRGEGTLVLGGEVVDASGKPAAANAPGTSIRSGVEYKLKAGDAIYVPPHTNHQWRAEAGKPFTYFTVNE